MCTSVVSSFRFSDKFYMYIDFDKWKRLNNIPEVFKVQGRTDSSVRYFESVYHEYLWIGCSRACT
jgi:hypothetical protein